MVVLMGEIFGLPSDVQEVEVFAFVCLIACI